MIESIQASCPSKIQRFSSFELFHVGPFRKLHIDLPRKTNAEGAEVHIFTGENGTGKSTILRAFSSFYPRNDAIREKVWNLNLFEGDNSKPPYCRFFSASHSLFETVDFAINKDSAGYIYGNPNFGNIFSPGNSGQGAQALNSFRDLYEKPNDYFNANTVEYAMFSYAGGRTITPASISGINELNESPLVNALSFDVSVNTANILQWIANTEAKIDRAFRQGNSERVARLGESLERIQGAIIDIVGYPIAFSVEDEPRLRVVMKLRGREVPFNALPDGLKSILSWVSDLLIRLDRLPWAQSDLLPHEQNFALFLDEIDVHLHPKWQRSVLRIAQSLFPNAQIFIATHSPFVPASIEGGWIHRLKLDENGEAYCVESVPTRAGSRYSTVMGDVFDLEEDFDIGTENDLKRFRELRNQYIDGDAAVLCKLMELSGVIAKRSDELAYIMGRELAKIERRG